MYVHAKDNNILKYGALVLKVYQEKPKMRYLQPEINNIFGSEKNQKKLTKGGAHFSLNIDLCFRCSRQFLIIYQILMEECAPQNG